VLSDLLIKYPVNSEKKMIGEVVGAIEHAPQSGIPMKFKDEEEP
jgi:hypothetical protein